MRAIVLADSGNVAKRQLGGVPESDAGSGEVEVRGIALRLLVPALAN
jgi:hypothetical protein